MEPNSLFARACYVWNRIRELRKINKKFPDRRGWNPHRKKISPWLAANHRRLKLLRAEWAKFPADIRRAIRPNVVD